MPETERSSSNTNLSVEHLLKLKRAEKPQAEFWAEFERNLQQKQLQALVRPSVWTRLCRLLLPQPVVAGLSAAAALALAGLALFAVLGEFEIESNEPHDQEKEMMEMADAGGDFQSETPAETAVTRSGGALFVIDVLRPEVAEFKPFRKSSHPETWTGSHDRSASYAVNTFTTRRDSLVDDEVRAGF